MIDHYFRSNRYDINIHMTIVVTISLILAQAWTFYAYRHKIEEGFQKYLQCSLELGENCVRFRTAPPYGFNFVANNFGNPLVGLILFGCFATTPEVVQWWRDVFHGRIRILGERTTSSRFTWLHRLGRTSGSSSQGKSSRSSRSFGSQGH
jgi:hypothetical protein